MTVSNQALQAAEARFRQARAMIGYARASEFPTISTGVDVSSVRQSAHRPFSSSTARGGSSGDFVLSFDLAYELDLWGRIRRTVTAARVEAQATAADLQTVQLSLQAELARNYFALRSVAELAEPLVVCRLVHDANPL